MKKDKVIKAGTIIEAGNKDNLVTGQVRVVLKGEGKGNKTLYKCVFNSPVRIRETVEGETRFTKPKTTHILYKNQFEVMDY